MIFLMPLNEEGLDGDVFVTSHLQNFEFIHVILQRKLRGHLQGLEVEDSI
jgi:hypothetical protein